MTNDDDLKKRLVALLALFRDKPNILVNYLLHFDALKKDFKERIKTNPFLKDISGELSEQKDIVRPYFTSFPQMQDFYNQAFIRAKDTKSTNVLAVANEPDVLRLQLRSAVEDEDFARAARIKKYMDDLGMDSSLIF